MKKKVRWIRILLGITILFILGIIVFVKSTEPAKEDVVNVYKEGSFIVYEGGLADEGVDKVKELYTEEVDRLVLNSTGGDINIGMDLGEWVFDNQLDVEIRGEAFSSAANYVFTAGKTKYLHKDSMVGWHGGATQDSGSWITDFLLKSYLKKSIAREEAFFDKIGVDQRSTTYGQQDEFYIKYPDENYIGWTYSLESMEKLGIKNIKLIDGEWAPSDSFSDGKKLFTVTDVNLE